MHNELTTKFVKLLEIKRYSKNTIKTYRDAVTFFLKYFEKTDPSEIRHEDIFRYIEHKVKDDKISFSTQKGIVGAIKLFYKHLYNKNIGIDYIYPDRTEYKLPKVLSQEDIKNILNTIYNIKHKAIISTLYSCGLRISELVNLKITDIDSKRMMVRIENSKGYKDREVMLSEKLLELLRAYYKQYKPKIYEIGRASCRERV